MRSGQHYTYCLCLVLADFAAQPGSLDTVLYRLGAIGHAIGKSDQLTVEMCPVRIGINRHINLSLGILSFYMA